MLLLLLGLLPLVSKAYLPPLHHPSTHISPHTYHSSSNSRSKSSFVCHLVPKDITFEANQIEITKVLGKIEVLTDKSILEGISLELDRFGDEQAIQAYKNWVSVNGDATKATSVRIFEARIPGGTRCFIKEYLPIGFLFGKRELSCTRKLTTKWNELLQANAAMSAFPPIPILLGSLRTDERILDANFRRRWMKLFPKSAPPAEGNLWLLFRWDESTFKTIRSYPALPQVIEGFDYFRPNSRIEKSKCCYHLLPSAKVLTHCLIPCATVGWRFIRKLLRKTLEAMDYIHRCGYTHNALSSDSVWLTSTDQQEMASVDVRVTDLGSCQKISELGPYARTQLMEDIYQLGFIFIQVIIASFCDRNNLGAREVRNILAGVKTADSVLDGIMAEASKIDQNQLNQREFQKVFETICDSDFQSFRLFVKSVKGWREGYEMLEANEGAAWKLVLKMLARGRLYDTDREKPLKVTGASLIRDHENLFFDTFGSD